jgi:hypothetical protein
MRKDGGRGWVSQWAEWVQASNIVLQWKLRICLIVNPVFIISFFHSFIHLSLTCHAYSLYLLTHASSTITAIKQKLTPADAVPVAPAHPLRRLGMWSYEAIIAPVIAKYTNCNPFLSKMQKQNSW